MKQNYEIYMTYRTDQSGGEVIDPNDEWSSHEDQYIEFNPIAVAKSAEGLKWYETISLSFDPSLVDKIFVVIVRYGDGDTFGHTCGNWHVEGGYSTLEKAKTIKTSIENDEYGKSGKKEEHYQYLPWKGYFASLETVEIHSFPLRDTVEDCIEH